MQKKICNMCGKEFDLLDEQSNFGFHYRVGYGSKFDLSRIDLNLCCDCFDSVMDYILPKCVKNPITDDEDYQI